MKAIGEWLAQIPDKEARFRVLTYWMWREKSGHDPRVEEWTDAIAEECTERVGAELGFTGRQGHGG
jgi:DNA-binding transcriptional LysR family regulator